MNIIRRTALSLIRFNMTASHITLRSLDKVGFYRRLYATCGFSEEMARNLERAQSLTIRDGITDFHNLLARWAQGDIPMGQFQNEFLIWYGQHVERCTTVLIREIELHSDTLV